MQVLSGAVHYSKKSVSITRFIRKLREFNTFRFDSWQLDVLTRSVYLIIPLFSKVPLTIAYATSTGVKTCQLSPKKLTKILPTKLETSRDHL